MPKRRTSKKAQCRLRKYHIWDARGFFVVCRTCGTRRLRKYHEWWVVRVLRAATTPVEENCKTCRFGGHDVCKRHAPIYNPKSTYPTWPSNYNDGYGTWCGDYEKNKKNKKNEEINNA